VTCKQTANNILRPLLCSPHNAHVLSALAHGGT